MAVEEPLAGVVGHHVQHLGVAGEQRVPAAAGQQVTSSLRGFLMAKQYCLAWPLWQTHLVVAGQQLHKPLSSMLHASLRCPSLAQPSKLNQNSDMACGALVDAVAVAQQHVAVPVRVVQVYLVALHKHVPAHPGQQDTNDLRADHTRFNRHRQLVTSASG